MSNVVIELTEEELMQLLPDIDNLKHLKIFLINKLRDIFSLSVFCNIQVKEIDFIKRTFKFTLNFDCSRGAINSWQKAEWIRAELKSLDNIF